jgi:hypothetical protein
MDVGGLGTTTYRIELRRSGQLAGTGKINPGGVLGVLGGGMGFDHLLYMELPVHGSWEYRTSDLTASMAGQQHSEVINIVTTGRERRPVRGRDYAGRTYALERISP